jgi:hypothetical protein
MTDFGVEVVVGHGSDSNLAPSSPPALGFALFDGEPAPLEVQTVRK